MAARIAFRKTGTFIPLQHMTPARLSGLIDETLNNPEYRRSAVRTKETIARGNGLERPLTFWKRRFIFAAKQQFEDICGGARAHLLLATAFWSLVSVDRMPKNSISWPAISAVGSNATTSCSRAHRDAVICRRSKQAISEWQLLYLCSRGSWNKVQPTGLQGQDRQLRNNGSCRRSITSRRMLCLTR